MSIDERRNISNMIDTAEMIKHVGQYTMQKMRLPVAIKKVITLPMTL
jgi:hypothetical protein